MCFLGLFCFVLFCFFKLALGCTETAGESGSNQTPPQIQIFYFLFFIYLFFSGLSVNMFFFFLASFQMIPVSIQTGPHYWHTTCASSRVCVV